MNSSDIPRKSDLGREEIKSQSLGVLPREARTLLIMIDGKKTYQSYIDSLNKSKMFGEFGGVEPLFELLLDFQCIEIIEQDSPNVAEQTPVAFAQSKPVQLKASDNLTSTSSVDIQPTIAAFVEPSSRPNNEAEFATEFANATSNQLIGKGTGSSNNYESIKSDLASYIEKNAPSQDAWGYLLSLEQCENSAQLLMLVEKIQKAPGSSQLSRGMDKYSKALKQ